VRPLHLFLAGLAYAYAGVEEAAQADKYVPIAKGMSWLEAIFYRSLQSAFMRGFTACDPTAFLTTTVRTQCTLRDRLLGGTHNSSCSRLPDGNVGLFCKQGNMRQPYYIDRTLVFPPKDSTFKEVQRQANDDVSDFGMWVNCKRAHPLAPTRATPGRTGGTSLRPRPSRGPPIHLSCIV
jgi:hypothetical protein